MPLLLPKQLSDFLETTALCSPWPCASFFPGALFGKLILEATYARLPGLTQNAPA